MQTIQDEILRLKEEKNAIILAHYYQDGRIQDIADMVGDSYGLSKRARDNDADVIVFCGVKFMAESAKILSPHKKVLLPVMDAGCPMADMVTPEDVIRLRAEYPEAAVACYVNSSSETKAQCDVCVTSSNAVRVVRALKEKQVIFVPDQNLGRYVAQQVPEKEIILFSGYCIVHHQIGEKEAIDAKAAVPGAPLLVHPECTQGVVDQADFVGSTAQIIEYAAQSSAKEMIIGTEMGILHVLQKQNPDKKFYILSQRLVCANMKKTSIEDLRDALKYEQHEIVLPQDVMDGAKKSLDRMLAV